VTFGAKSLAYGDTSLKITAFPIARFNFAKHLASCSSVAAPVVVVSLDRVSVVWLVALVVSLISLARLLASVVSLAVLLVVWV